MAEVIYDFLARPITLHFCKVQDDNDFDFAEKRDDEKAAASEMKKKTQMLDNHQFDEEVELSESGTPLIFPYEWLFRFGKRATWSTKNPRKSRTSLTMKRFLFRPTNLVRKKNKG